ncbi:phage tail assembly chaperone protein [Caudoviricetes sp.]|nr:phage tail assembly chaperone protein [Caudoviricetes sp.]
MFALIENGAVKQYPYSIGALKRSRPNTSFPHVVSDSVMAEFGALRVFFSTQPEVTATQVLEEATPVFSTEDQRWTQVWTVRDMTTDEVSQQAASKAAEVRQQRDALLVSSDWTQVLDAPVDQAAWATYRQALRDITTQTGFPQVVEWPISPV